MAVAFDAKATAQGAFTAKATPADCTTLTIGSGANRALVALIGTGNTALTGVTCIWDPAGTNQAMTLIRSDIANVRGVAYLYGLVAPTSGNKTIRFAWTGGGTTDIVVDGVAWTGVDQTGGATSFPNGATAKSSTTTASAAVTITSATGDAAIAISVNDTNIYNTHSQTLVFEEDTLNDIGACGSRAAGAASVTFTDVIASTADWVSSGCSIKAVAVGGDLSLILSEGTPPSYF